MAVVQPTNLSDFVPRRGAPDARARREARRLSTIVAIATGAFLIVAPVAVMVVLPPSAERRVELSGSVLGFTQAGDAIEVSLMAADAGQRVFVEDGRGNIVTLPVSPGQTIVNAHLPARFADADKLTIRVG